MSVKRFDAFLTEATEQKNLHLAHLEDTLMDGPQAATYALNMLKEFGDMLSGGQITNAISLSTKWDGSPAIVFGPDPADGQFFVGTKSVFNVKPKLAKSSEDIDRLYGPDSLGHIMKTAFLYLKDLHPGIVLQGDILTVAAALTPVAIDGQRWLTFRPNTITYAVPETGELAQKLRRAALALVVHTAYVGTGASLAELSAVPITPEQFATLRQTPDVVVLDPNFDDLYDKLDSGLLYFTSEEQHDFLLALDTAAGVDVHGLAYDVVSQNPIRQWLQQFLNYVVRQGWGLEGFEYFNEFVLWLKAREERAVSTRATLEGQQNVARRFANYVDTLYQAKDALIGWFNLYVWVAHTKDIVVGKLGAGSQIATYLDTPQGYRSTEPEGFVAVAEGRSVKLVNRREFSRENFARFATR